LIAEAVLRFYDKPRNRLLLVMGGFLVTPLVKSIKREIILDEERLNDKVILLGRLELTQTLLKKWWVE